MVLLVISKMKKNEDTFAAIISLDIILIPFGKVCHGAHNFESDYHNIQFLLVAKYLLENYRLVPYRSHVKEMNKFKITTVNMKNLHLIYNIFVKTRKKTGNHQKKPNLLKSKTPYCQRQLCQNCDFAGKDQR
jgi:hypothetical protein